MKAAAKSLLRRAWGVVPGKGVIARAAALAPPAFKKPRVHRVLTTLIGEEDLVALGKIETNLGMAIPPLSISGRASDAYFFGTPEHFRGERGALLLARILSPRCDAFIDVGANHGYFVYYVGHALASSVPIHYFEPVPELFDEIEENVRRMGLVGACGHRLAVGERTGEATFYLDRTDTTSSSLTPAFAARHTLEETVVQVTTFDDFMATQAFQNACVKVDIENAEQAFLAGVREHGHRIGFLIIEVLAPAIRAGFVNTAREQLGMHAYYVDDLTLRISRDGTYVFRRPSKNWLFCRLEPEALRRLLAGTALQVA